MDIQELVVRATPEGMSDVNDGLESVERKVGDTTRQVDKSAAALGGLARKFKGAMTVIIAGLAVGVAGVLSQVPVLGEAMDGLKSIFNALALQIDQRLRPFMNKLNQEFFELAGAIAEGDYEGVKEELTDIFNVFKGVDIGKVIGDFVSALQTLVSDINFEQLAGRLIEFQAQLRNRFIDAISNFANELSVSDVQNVAATIIRIIKKQLFTQLTQVDWLQLLIAIIKLIGKIGAGVVMAIKNEIVDPLIGAIGKGFNNAIGAASEWGRNLLENFISGIKSKISELRSAVRDVGRTIRNAMPGAGMGIETSVSAGGSQRGTGGLSNQDFIGSVGSSASAIYLDGSRVDDNQGRFRKGSLTRRGR